MTFEEKLTNQEYDRIWQEYCGFLDLDMESYMKIQRRLLEEQIGLWCASPLGKKILKDIFPFIQTFFYLRFQSFIRGRRT